METKIHFLSFLAEFFLEGEIFLTKVVETMKTQVSRSATLLFVLKIVVPFMR